MKLEVVAQCRVALTGGSWPDCRDALDFIGQLSLVSPQVARIRGLLRNNLYIKFPAAIDFEAFQRDLCRAYERLPAVILHPLRTPDFLAVMTNEDEFLGPRCSLLACRRQLGRSLLEPEYPIYWNGTGVEPDRTTDVHAWDDIWASHPSGQQGEGPDSVRGMGERLTVCFEEQTAAMEYSRRRRRWVKIHHGCFACSKDCYENIIDVIRLWEGPLEMHQAVVITAVN